MSKAAERMMKSRASPNVAEAVPVPEDGKMPDFSHLPPEEAEMQRMRIMRELQKREAMLKERAEKDRRASAVDKFLNELEPVRSASASSAATSLNTKVKAAINHLTAIDALCGNPSAMYPATRVEVEYHRDAIKGLMGSIITESDFVMKLRYKQSFQVSQLTEVGPINESLEANYAPSMFTNSK